MAFGDERYGRKEQELVRIEVEEVLVDRDQDEAILVSTPEQEQGVWIPRSMISDRESSVKTGELIAFHIPEWLAVDRGLV